MWHPPLATQKAVLVITTHKGDGQMTRGQVSAAVQYFAPVAAGAFVILQIGGRIKRETKNRKPKNVYAMFSVWEP